MSSPPEMLLSLFISVQFSSVQSLSHVRLFATPWIAACQASLSITNSRSSRPSSQWCHPAISSSVIPYSSCPQPLPASESFPMSQLFAWGGQSTGVSALASLLPKNTQDRSPLEWTGWISLQSKGLSRVFSNTTVQKHQFFDTQQRKLNIHSMYFHTSPCQLSTYYPFPLYFFVSLSVVYILMTNTDTFNLYLFSALRF